MRIQVVQDLICPWCRIGKHNLDGAIAEWTKTHDDSVEVEWVPFLLDPVEPGSKEPYQQRLREQKQMSQEQIEEMFARAKEAEENVGLDFNFDKIDVAVDTIPGHQMVTLAPQERQSALLDGIHAAYFENGKDIGDIAVLASIGESVGMSEEELDRVRGAWASDELRLEMVKVVQQVQNAGISGVPFFIIDSSLGVNGAQPTDVMVQAMQQAQEVPAAD